jgi:hypothetical protein
MYSGYEIAPRKAQRRLGFVTPSHKSLAALTASRRSSAPHTYSWCAAAAPPCARRGCGSLQEAAQLLVAHQVGARVVLVGRDALAQHHLDPRVLANSSFITRKARPVCWNMSMRCCSGAGTGHLRSLLPVGRVAAVGHLVVQDDEVADEFDLGPGLGVEFVDVALADALRGEVLQQAHDGALDQVDAGRLDRLQEAARQADRDAVVRPGLACAGPA